jgi:hypothetical protein
MLRRRIKDDVVLTKKSPSGQQVLALGFDKLQDEAMALWQYTVVVTNAPYELQAIGQLYRDRCDCENGFDEQATVAVRGGASDENGRPGGTALDADARQGGFDQGDGGPCFGSDCVCETLCGAIAEI